MNRLALAFYTAGALCALAGMIWGTIMGATGDFLLSPAHAHLNLVGWASLALMGGFYGLSGRAGRLGWINFFLSTAGAAVMVPFLALYLSGDTGAHVGVAVGSVLAVAGMVAFVASVLSAWNTARD